MWARSMWELGRKQILDAGCYNEAISLLPNLPSCYNENFHEKAMTEVLFRHL